VRYHTLRFFNTVKCWGPNDDVTRPWLWLPCAHTTRVDQSRTREVVQVLFLSRVHTSEPSEGEVGFGAPACQVFSSTELVENLELLCQRTNSFTFPFTFTSPTQLKLTHGAQHETTQKPFRLESVFIMEPKTTQSTARNKKIKSLYENELQV